MNQDRELPGLAGIGAFITWCEELLALVSGPLVTAGLLIGLMALLTNGQLLVRVPALLWVWAGAMALGLDAQFIGAAAKLASAIRRRAGWVIVGYIILCAALGYVAFIASDVFSVQEANGITTGEALARLGMDNTNWIVQRSVLAVVLVFLSGFLRYVSPAKVNVALSAEEERAQLEADLLLEPLRQRKRVMQTLGVRGIAAAALGRQPIETPATLQSQFTQVEPEPAAVMAAENAPPVKPPTGPGSPARKPRQRAGVITPTGEDASNVTQLPTQRRRGRGRTAASGRGTGRAVRASVEEKARAHFTLGMSASELARTAHIGKSAASKYRTALTIEALQAQQKEQAAQ